MARVFTDGAETGDDTFWTITNIPLATATQSPRSGTYHYYAGGSANATKAFTEISEGYWRIAAKSTSLGSNQIQFRNGTTELLRLTINSLGKYVVSVATTGDTGNDSIVAATYHLLEVYYKISNTVGVITIKINGVQKFTFSGDTQPGTATTVDNIYFSWGTGQALAIDDLAMNDTSGSVDNSWCGDGRVYALTVNGAGDSTQWTPSTGSNYQCVDELPPSDTDYVVSSDAGYIDNYNLTTYTLQLGENILRLWPVVRVKDAAISGVLNLGVKTLGTNYTISVNTPTSFDRIEGSGYVVNPNTGSAWTQAQLDALQLTIQFPS